MVPDHAIRLAVTVHRTLHSGFHFCFFRVTFIVLAALVLWCGQLWAKLPLCAGDMKSDTLNREWINIHIIMCGYAVAQLVEALCYEPEGRAGSIPDGVTGIFRWRNPSGCGSGSDSGSNRNEHHEYYLRGKGGRCVGLTTLPPTV